MAILHTTCGSVTGKFLYSDTYLREPPTAFVEGYDDNYIHDMPKLNTLAAIPILGHVAGAARIALSIIHMIGHSCAALVLWDRGHMYHVAKGGAEFLRGTIEILPIIGRVFVWCYDARSLMPHSSSTQPSYQCKFFLIKIHNPEQPDNIDRYLSL